MKPLHLLLSKYPYFEVLISCTDDIIWSQTLHCMSKHIIKTHNKQGWALNVILLHHSFKSSRADKQAFNHRNFGSWTSFSSFSLVWHTGISLGALHSIHQDGILISESFGCSHIYKTYILCTRLACFLGVLTMQRRKAQIYHCHLSASL